MNHAGRVDALLQRGQVRFDAGSGFDAIDPTPSYIYHDIYRSLLRVLDEANAARYRLSRGRKVFPFRLLPKNLRRGL